MSKRQKWVQAEDCDLRALIAEDPVDTKWDVVAMRMDALGYAKNAKQCRER